MLRDESYPHSHSAIDFDTLSDANASDGTSAITIADAHTLFHGDFKRVGPDLKITGENGKTFLVQDYFKTEHRATLFSPDGAQLSGDIVAALAGPQAPGQYAQATAPVSDATPIGRVATVSGSAQAVRNGVAVTLNTGDQILKGDVVQTGSDSALGVIFTDGTTFNLSSNSRMVLNEFVYDPNGSNNAAAISLVQGTISFLAGQVAKTGDMKVGTPVATMGIRGTAVNVTISADNGATNISVMAEADNLTHTVQVFALPTQADLAAGRTVGALLGTVTNNSGVFVFNPTPTGVLVQELAKDITTVQKELTIVQQVFQTQAVGQQFLQNNNTQTPDKGGDTKTAQPAQGTQFTVTDRATVHTESNAPPPAPTTIKIVIGNSTDTTDDTHHAPVTVNHPPVANADVGTAISSGVVANNIAFAGKPIVTGNIIANDTDVDTSDKQTVTAVTAVSAHLHGTLTINSNGEYTYELDNTDPTTRALAAGETATDVFSYTITDLGGLTSTSTLTITITGTDDKPVITVADKAQIATITERDLQTGVISNDTQTGTIHFTDVDLTDRPTATISSQVLTYVAANGTTVLTLTTSQIAAIKAAFSLTAESLNANNGTIDWKYSIQDKLLDFLAKDEKVTVTSTVLVDDHHGGTDTATVTITIIGTDDAPNVGVPVIAPDDKLETGALTETVNSTDQTAPHLVAVSGTTTVQKIHFTDVDSSDRPVATISLKEATYYAANGTTVLDLGAHASVLKDAFTISPDPTNTNNGAINWAYQIPENEIDFLAAGEKVVLTATVRLDDGNGGVDTAQVVITINGTNDAPVLSADTAATHDITERAGTACSAADTTSGSLVFTDVDLTNTHTSSFAYVSAVWSGGASLPSGLDTTLAAALTTGVADSTGSGTGAVNFSFSAADLNFDFLANGETLTITYNVTVTDGTVSSTQPVVVTVAGTNDAPVLSATVTSASFTDTANDDTFTAVTGALSRTDVDLNDGAIYGITGGSSGAFTVQSQSYDTTKVGTYGTLYLSTSSGAYIYVPNDAAIEARKTAASETFQLTVTDGLASDVKTLTINITATNDTPTLTASVTSISLIDTVNDDTFNATTGQLTGADRDSGETLTYGISGGAATSFSLGGVDYDTVKVGTYGSLYVDSHTGAYVFVPNDAATEARVDNAEETFTFTVTDLSLSTTTVGVTVSVTGANDLPTITVGTNDSAAKSVTETDSAPYLTGSLTLGDRDAQTVTTYVTAVSVTEGSAHGLTNQQLKDFFTINPGSFSGAGAPEPLTWQFSGSGNPAQAFDFLRQGEVLKLQYTVLIQDAGGLQASQPVVITITGSNDVPTFSVTTPADISELGNAQAQSLSATGTLSAFDRDDGDLLTPAVLNMAVTLNGQTFTPAGGTGALNSATLTFGAAQTSDGVNSKVFTWNYSAGASNFDFLAAGDQLKIDYTVTVGDGVTDASSQHVVITVVGTNDAPIVTASSGTTAASEQIAIAVDNAVTVSDIDSPTLASATVSITGGFQAGQDVLAFVNDNTTMGNITASYNSSTGVLTLSSTGSTATLAQWQAALSAVTYTNTSDTPNTANRTISISVDDGQQNSHASAVTTKTVSVTALNDAPVNTAAAQSLSEDDATATFTGLHVSDADAGSATITTTLSVTHGKITIFPFGGGPSVSGSGTNSVTLSGSQTQINALFDANAKVGYVPDSNYFGTDTLTMTTSDGGSSGNGGTQTHTDTATITIASVNDRPSAASNTVTSLEDGSYTFTAADFGFSDAQDALGPGGANNFINVVIDSLPGAGTLTKNGVAVSANAFISIADINAGKLVFTPAANGNGANYASFLFRVQDDGGGGTNRNTSTQSTMTLAVTAVNDAPAGTDKAVTTLEDTGYTFTTADFGFTDQTDAGATGGANALLSVKITTLPGAGTLKLDGVAVAAGAFVLATDIAAGKLVFTPAANANGSAYASFTFQVKDNGGTANNGVDLDQSPNTITVNVTAVNDAPVNTVPGAQTVNEDTDLAIPAFHVSDVEDQTQTTYITTLSATHGSITVGEILGGAQISGNGTHTVTLTGTLAQINTSVGAAAQGAWVTYSPDANFNGSDALVVSTNDQGNAGQGGAQTTSTPIPITVSAVNDAPTGGVTITGTAQAGEQLTANTTTLADNDVLGTLHYQWQRIDGSNVVTNVGTDASQYTPTAADIGQTIKVVVSYTDGGGTAESVTSAATDTVILANFSNGSFEQPGLSHGVNDPDWMRVNDGGTTITGWVAHGAQGIDYNYDNFVSGVYYNYAASDGHYSVELNGNAAGSIAQTFHTVAGQQYAVHFDLSGYPDGSNGYTSYSVGVSAANDSRTYEFVSHNNHLSNMGWTGEVFYFTATGAETTLQFSSLTGGTAAGMIDNVQVTATGNAHTASFANTGASGDVTEDDASTLTTGGTLSVTDADAGENIVMAHYGAATYGTFNLQANGGWTYTADNSQSAIQQLGAGQTLTDSFTAYSFDGTASKTVTVTIHGVNDAPAISGDLAVTVNQGGETVLTVADLQAADVDSASSSVSFNVTTAVHGYLAFAGALGTSITSFTEAQLEAGSVLFVSDGSLDGNGTPNPASFTVTATDGSATSSASTVNVAVSGDIVVPVNFDLRGLNETAHSLTQSGGTVTGTGTLVAQGGTNAITGGTQTGGGTTALGGTTTIFAGAVSGASFTLDNRTLDLGSPDFNFNTYADQNTLPATVSIGGGSAGNTIYLNNGSHLVLGVSGSTLNDQGGNTTITSSAGTAGTVTNYGTWTVSGHETLGVGFDNEGTLVIAGGATLTAPQLQSTGTNSNINFAAATGSPAGTLDIGAGNVAVRAFTVASNANGKVTGSGTLTAGSLFVSSGAALRESGGGTTVVTGGWGANGELDLDGYTLRVTGSGDLNHLTASINSTFAMLNASTLQVASGSYVEFGTSGFLSGFAGNTISVEAGGTLRFVIRQGEFQDGYFGTINNAGTIEIGGVGHFLLRSAGTDIGASYTGTGTIEFGADALGNSRSLDANSSITVSGVSIYGTLTDLGTYNVGTTGATKIAGGATANLTGTVTNLGTATVSGTLNLGAGNAAAKALTLATDATGSQMAVQGSGTLTVTNAGTFNGGTVRFDAPNLSGGGTMVVHSGTTFFNGNNLNLVLDNYTLDIVRNAGASSQLDGNVINTFSGDSIYLNNSAQLLIHAGLQDLSNGVTFATGDNTGSVTVEAGGIYYRQGAGTTVFNTAFNGAGTGTGTSQIATIQILEGGLQFNAGGSFAATNIDPSQGGTAIDFHAGNFTFDSASTLSGSNLPAGDFLFDTTGTSTVHAAITGSVVLSNGTMILDANANDSNTKLTMTSGTLKIGTGVAGDATATATLGQFTQTGDGFSASTVTGNGVLKTGQADFNGAISQTGTGTTEITGSTTFGSGTALTMTLDQRTVQLDASASFAIFQNATIHLNDSASFAVQAGRTVHHNSGTLLIDSTAGTAGTFSNAGTWTMTGGASETFNVAVSNTGTMETAGTMHINGAVTGTGTIQVDDVGTLELGSTVASGQTITLSGTGGTLKLDAAEGFSGTISSLNGTAANSTDKVDLANIDFTSANFSRSYNAGTGVLTVSDGTHTATLHFTNTTGSIKLAGDGASGTLITAGSNDAPETGAASASGNEDAASISVQLAGTDDFAVTQFKITALPTAAMGFLFADAAHQIALAVNDTVTADGQGHATVYFVPAADFNGDATFTYASVDGSSAADATPATATIHLAAVNDAPVATITPTTYSATEQTTLTLKGSGLAISDVDAGSGSMTVTLAVTQGTLNATAGDSGATVTSGNGTSTVTITGTTTQINNLLGSTGTSTLSYIDNLDRPAASATLTMSVNDNGNSGSGGSQTGSDTATINITAVNDAPTPQDDANPPFTFTEDTDTVIPASAMLANDSDPDGDTLTIVSVTRSGQGGGSTVSFDGTNITYHPGANYNGFDYFFYTVSDGQAQATRSVTFNVGAVSDAPVLAAASPSLTTITEDDTTNSGQTVASFLGSTITDPDSGALKGIAITGVSSTNGGWQFSIDNGATWSNFGAYIPNTALLLKDTDLVRFVPNGINGGTDTFTYKAWDQTSGTHGQTVDASTGGGSTAFSTGSNTASLTVTSVNDVPVVDLNGAGGGNNATASFTEQTSVLVVPSATLTDIDSANLASLTVTLTARPDGNAVESLSLNSAAASAASGLTVTYTASTGVLLISGSASVSTYQTILDGVLYNDTSDTPNTAARTVTVVANDGATVVTSFQTAVTYSTGSSPVSVATADLNNDGYLDLIYANDGASSVSVRLGDGHGGFGSATNFNTASSPYFIATGDFNGDGKVDVAVSTFGSSVSVLLGNGSGGLGAKTDFATAGSSPAVATADFDGDGNLDLVVARFSQGGISILPGNGTGGFGTRTDIGGQAETYVATGDFNGDGKLDVVAAAVNSNDVQLFLNNSSSGTISFGSPTNLTTGAKPWTLAVADLNGDGKADIVTANANSNTVSVLLGNGNGTFAAKQDYAVGTNPQFVKIVDLNGDGILDLAVANDGAASGNASQSISLLLGNGDGTFGTKTDIATGTSGATGANNGQLAAGDFNGDGQADLAFVYQGSNNLAVLLNSSTSNLSVARTSTISVTAVNDAPSVSGVTISETGIDFTISDVDSSSFAIVGPFDTAFGGIAAGANHLVPAAQTSAMTGALAVSDGAGGTATVISLVLGEAGNEVLDLTSTSAPTAIYGFGGEDFIYGGSGADYIYGGANNDYIIGAQNDVVLDGGSGSSDELGVNANFADTGDGQIVNIEMVTLNAALTLNLSHQTEDFIITGSAGADNITGGSGADTINGGGGNDTITGGLGADVLTGGNGSDTFVFASAAEFEGDTINGTAEAGTTDVIKFTTGGTYNLANATISNIDNIVLTDTAGGYTVTVDNATASTAAYNDTAHLLHFGSGGSTVTGSVAIDGSSLTSDNRLFVNAGGFAGNNTLTGGAGIDQLNGGNGGNTITGGGGGDNMSGGSGVDTFVFKAVTDSVSGSTSTWDAIASFTHGQDHFDFSAIAGLNSQTQTVNFMTDTSAPTTLAAHTIDIVTIGANTVIYANSTGATAAADMEIHVTGVTNLTSADFILHV